MQQQQSATTSASSSAVSLESLHLEHICRGTRSDIFSAVNVEAPTTPSPQHEQAKLYAVKRTSLLLFPRNVQERMLQQMATAILEGTRIRQGKNSVKLCLPVDPSILVPKAVQQLPRDDIFVKVHGVFLSFVGGQQHQQQLPAYPGDDDDDDDEDEVQPQGAALAPQRMPSMDELRNPQFWSIDMLMDFYPKMSLDMYIGGQGTFSSARDGATSTPYAPPPLEDVLTWLKIIAEKANYLSSTEFNIHNICLRPDHLFISDDGKDILFADFLLSTQTLGASNAERALCNSLRFRAPEQLLDGWGTDRKAPFWGLGILLNRILFGVIPFARSATTRAAVRDAVVIPPSTANGKERPFNPAWSSIATCLPPSYQSVPIRDGLSTLLVGLLRRDSSVRFGYPEFCRAVRKIETGEDSGSSTPTESTSGTLYTTPSMHQHPQ